MEGGSGLQSDQLSGARNVSVAAPMRPILRLGSFGLALLLVSVVSQITDAGTVASQQLPASGVARTSSGAGGQTVYDPLLKVTWLADSNLASRETFNVRGINRDGAMDYQTAVTWVKAMDAYDHGKGYHGHDNWMLPATTPYDPNCSSYNKAGGGSAMRVPSTSRRTVGRSPVRSRRRRAFERHAA